jgi:D-alanyl-D-alanine carboxypeptidase/D-alanyl-D-alanine-endopeptidase (penicillin-binding protein 4)
MMRRGRSGRVAKWLGGGVMGLLAGAIALPLPAGALCPAEVSAAVDAIAARPELRRARLGIQVETLTGETLLSREGDRFFVPASTLKLLTTAAVLTELGPAYQLRTVVLGRSHNDDRLSLEVIGQGDPSFAHTDLQALAQQLQQQGVRQVETLYGNDEAFPGALVNPNWEWEDVQAGYGAPVNALILDENEIGLTLVPQAVGEPLQVVWDDPDLSATWMIENDSLTVTADEPEFVTVGRDLSRPIVRVFGQLIAGADPEPASIAVPNPGERFLQRFQRSLAEHGIMVAQTRLAAAATAEWRELAVVESPTLAELLVPTNQDSNNLYAEALLKTLGRAAADRTDATTAGIAATMQSLQAIGLDPEAVVMVDGSGLARKNLITPEAMVDVLQGMARSPQAAVYRDSLAIAGVSGTLKNRWLDSPVAGHLYGKSGAISRNFALAGYLEPPQAEPVAFSIFINNLNERGRVARQLIDDIVLTMFELESCRPSRP